MDQQKLSSGVQELIDRLREEGIGEGRSRAEEVLNEARQEADDIVAKARDEAARIIGKARSEAQRFQQNAEEALAMAGRDTVLELKAELTNRFSRRVAEMIGTSLNDETFLQRVILEIAGKVRHQVGDREKLEILLPEDVIGLDELRRHPEKVKEGSLGQFALSAAEEMFREGVTITAGPQKRGILIKLVDEELQIDINEKVVGEILLKHLLPRFRALLEGSIQ
ncbi:MAG: hypothetical protein C0613_06490 [Desulfobulbaceae bacterium]|nr:MAG: hypothetical protein C0613_06490 [Desulfobulbaceae bacterium]